tara:strand:+ start:867 stop:1058 length:192 start_codon:yes stop_codon:yes gene_type:complete
MGAGKMPMFEVMLTRSIVEVYDVEASNEAEASSKALAGEGVLDTELLLGYDAETLVYASKEET